MAKDTKNLKATKTGTELPSKEAFEKALEEAQQRKNAAADMSGKHGAVVKNFCERYGMDKTVFNFTRKLREMSPERRQDTLRQVFEATDLMGYTDQADLFDDGTDDRVREEAGKSRRVSGAKPDGTIDDLAGGAEPRPH